MRIIELEGEGRSRGFFRRLCNDLSASWEGAGRGG